MSAFTAVLSSAGGGKTYALLMECMRHTNNSKFGAVIFRKNANQVMSEGGLFSTAMEIYPLFGATPKQTPKPMFVFPSGSKVTFAHLQYDNDVLGWQGSQLPLCAFDELTHFSKQQFFYMLSRNRSMCGVKPYIRATTNPDAESWVADFISWWIDDNGYAIPERSGVIRYFIRVNDQICWGDSRRELVEKYAVEEADCKSFTFIASSIYDNKILLEQDSGYLANLKALSRVERERLLGGNWKIKPASGLYFKRHEATLLDFEPKDITQIGRAWDLAASEKTESNPNPDYTAGVKMGIRANGRYVVLDYIEERLSAHNVRAMVLRTANNDGKKCRIKLPQDPGQAGKEQVQSYVKMLAGFTVKTERVTGDKVTRAEPFAAQWQAGNVDVVRGAWNERYFACLEGFPDEASKDDGVDASSDCFSLLSKSPGKLKIV